MVGFTINSFLYNLFFLHNFAFFDLNFVCLFFLLLDFLLELHIFGFDFGLMVPQGHLLVELKRLYKTTFTL